MTYTCPGMDPRNLEISEETCPNCGYTVEMFSDETRLKCPRCGQTVYRKAVPACIDWCSRARECIGAEKYDKLRPDGKPKQSGVDFKEKILAEMVGYFGDDIRRIAHAMKVTHFAEKILKYEPEADRRIAVLAAILHDIGIKECERKYNSADAHLQEKEGPPVAREMMKKAGIKNDIIEEVCAIIAGHHTPGKVNTLNFRILWDADSIVNFEQELSKANPEYIANKIDRMLMTESGCRVAHAKFGC